MSFHVLNTTRGTALAGSARRADSFISRGRGLMMAAPLEQGTGLIIEPCNSIHMFFMRYPLDIVFIDKSGKVLFMYKGIKPWRLGRVVRGARTAIELPAGAVEASGTQVGDNITISDSQS